MSDQIDLFVGSNIVLFNRWPSNFETGVHIGSGINGTMLTDHVECILNTDEQTIIELIDIYAKTNHLSFEVHDNSLNKGHSRILRKKRKKPYVIWRGYKIADLPIEKQALFNLLDKIKGLKKSAKPWTSASLVTIKDG